MTRRGDKKQPVSVPATAPVTEVWAVVDYGVECHADDCECLSEGTSVVALFTTEQTAEQFADYKGLSVKRMSVNSAMRGLF